MWPFTRTHWVFQQPPCICEEIEAHVRDACALRDEMATWDTPLNEWKKLQQMQVLQPKAKPQPYVQPVYGELAPSVHISTSTYIGDPWTRQSNWKLPIYDGKVGFCLKLQPGEPFEVGSIIERGSRRYKITQRLFDNTNRVMARQLRWPP